jgi:molybdopterin/thiamine biosynthesis adenylyltransferase
MNFWSEFTIAFATNGFTYQKNNQLENAISYQGQIETTKFGRVFLEFRFEDMSLTSFPTAYLIDKQHPEIKPFKFPHLNEKWSLCYHDNSDVFNKFDPVNMVTFCIRSVKNTLEKTTDNNINEIIPEFKSYWDIESNYDGNINEEAEFIAFQKDKFVSTKKNIWNLNVEDARFDIPVFHLENIPDFTDVNWPIENYEDLKKWLSNYELLKSNLENYMKKCISNCKSNFPIVFKLLSLNYYFGFFILINDPLIKKNGKQKLRIGIINKIFNPQFIKINNRFWIENYTVQKIFDSNNPGMPTFNNKHILIIGAGTIGSNLTNLLVKNGAGTGKRGVIEVVDHDTLQLYNFSRHYLGLNYSQVNKAEALCQEIKRTAPFCNILAVNRNIIDFVITGYDLVIDSTGEEALTVFINEKIIEYRVKFSKEIFFISVWLSENGNIAECFININNTAPCHECFREYKRKNQLNTVERSAMRGSCGSLFIPFPITASLYASLLVINILNLWLAGNTNMSNYYRQDLKPIKAIEEYNINVNESCIACGKKCSMV